MRAQNFNFRLKFSQNGGFSPKVCIFERRFSDDKIFRQFSERPKIKAGNCFPVPAVTTPLLAFLPLRRLRPLRPLRAGVFSLCRQRPLRGKCTLRCVRCVGWNRCLSL